MTAIMWQVADLAEDATLATFFAKDDALDFARTLNAASTRSKTNFQVERCHYIGHAPCFKLGKVI